MELERWKNIHSSQDGVEDWNSDNLHHRNEPRECNGSQHRAADTLPENVISHFSYLGNRRDSYDMREGDLLPLVLPNESRTENLLQRAVACTTSDDVIPRDTNLDNARRFHKTNNNNLLFHTDGKPKVENHVALNKSRTGNLSQHSVAHAHTTTGNLSLHSVAHAHTTTGNLSQHSVAHAHTTTVNLSQHSVAHTHTTTGHLSQHSVAHAHTTTGNLSQHSVVHAHTTTGNLSQHSVAHVHTTAGNLSQHSVAHKTSGNMISKNTFLEIRRDSYEVENKISLRTDAKTEPENTVFLNGNLNHHSDALMTADLIHLSMNLKNPYFWEMENNNWFRDTIVKTENENPVFLNELRNENPVLFNDLRNENPVLPNELRNENPVLLNDLRNENPVLPNELRNENPVLLNNLRNENPVLPNELRDENSVLVNELHSENHEYQIPENVIPPSAYSENPYEACEMGSDNLYENADMKTTNETSILTNVSHTGNPFQHTVAHSSFENVIPPPTYVETPCETSYAEMHNLSQYTELKANNENLVALNKQDEGDLLQFTGAHLTSEYVIPSLNNSDGGDSSQITGAHMSPEYVIPSLNNSDGGDSSQLTCAHMSPEYVPTYTYLENYCDSYETGTSNSSQTNANTKTGDIVVLYEWHSGNSPNHQVLLAKSENSDPLSMYTKNVCNSYEIRNSNSPLHTDVKTENENRIPLNEFPRENLSQRYISQRTNARKEIENPNNFRRENLLPSMNDDFTFDHTYFKNHRHLEDYGLTDHTYCDLAPPIQEDQGFLNISQETETHATSENCILFNKLRKPSSRRIVVDLADRFPTSKSTYSGIQCKNTLKDHKNCNHYLRESLCYICGTLLLCEGERYFEKHLLTHFEFQPVRCDVCDYACKDERTLKNHYRVHKRKNNIKCDMCDEKFGTRQCLTAHLRSQHANREKSFKCAVCYKSYFDESSLSHHIDCAHVSIKGYTCGICGARYSILDTLRNHMDGKHIKIALYECKSCGKSFRTKPSLRQHMVSHVKKRTFDCTYCKKVFKSKTQLVDHRVIHTGLKPYKCNICSKVAYAHRSTLRNHKKTCSL